MKISAEMKELVYSLYPNENLSDYEVTEKANSLIQFFTIGAKEVYRFYHQKTAGNANNRVQLKENNVL